MKNKIRGKIVSRAWDGGTLATVIRERETATRREDAVSAAVSDCARIGTATTDWTTQSWSSVTDSVGNTEPAAYVHCSITTYNKRHSHNPQHIVQHGLNYMEARTPSSAAGPLRFGEKSWPG